VTVAVTAGAEFLAAQALQAGVAVVALLKSIILAVGPLPGWLAAEGVPLLGWQTMEDAHPHIRVVARLQPGAAAAVMEAEAFMPVTGLLPGTPLRALRTFRTQSVVPGMPDQRLLVARR